MRIDRVEYVGNWVWVMAISRLTERLIFNAHPMPVAQSVFRDMAFASRDRRELAEFFELCTQVVVT